MASLHIRKLTVEGFRSFVDRQSTQVLPLKGLYGIRGKNLDTGGSSGAGKSSVAYAIFYALGLLKAPYTAAKLKTKWSKVPMQVELDLEVDGVPCVLKRGKVTSIRVGAEQEVAGSVDAVDARLERLVGNPDLLRARIFRAQKKPGLFLTMKDAAKKEFLSGLLGLEELEREIEAATPKANKFKTEAEKYQIALEALTKRVVVPAQASGIDLAELEGTVLEAATKAEIFGPLLVVAKEDLAKATRLTAMQVKTTQASQRLDLEKFDEEQRTEVQNYPPRPTTQESDTAKALRKAALDCTERIKVNNDSNRLAENAARAILKQAEGALDKYRRSAAKEKECSQGLDKARKNIAKALEAKCPTCDQAWLTAQTQLPKWYEEEAKWLQQIAEAAAALAEIPNAELQITSSQKALSEVLGDTTITQLHQVQAEIQQRLANELASNQAEVKAYDAQLKAFQQNQASNRKLFLSEQARYLESTTSTYDSSVRSAQDKFQQLERSRVEAGMVLQKAQSALNQAKALNQAAQDRHDHELSIYDALQVDIAELERQIAENLGGAASEGDFALVLKSFMGGIFDEVLQEISQEANDLLRTIKNVATTTISFSSDKVTEKGSVKQQIKSVVLKNGMELDWEVELSGGQGESLELAVDLALGRVIGRRTGDRPGFLFLDESFAHLDMACKESCLEVLQKAAQDQLILIVDHSTELRDFFTGFIDLESRNEVSRFVS